jgi:hypothetical protein
LIACVIVPLFLLVIYLADYEESLPEEKDLKPRRQWASLDICQRGSEDR